MSPYCRVSVRPVSWRFLPAERNTVCHISHKEGHSYANRKPHPRASPRSRTVSGTTGRTLLGQRSHYSAHRKGEPPSLETLSALAAVFETRVEELTGAPLQAAGPLDEAVSTARRRLDEERHFYRSLSTAVVVCVGLFLINRFTSPESHWSLWVMLIWGGLLVVKGLRLFLLRGWIEQWQQQRLQKLLRK